MNKENKENSIPFPILITERLHLRQVTKKDSKEIYFLRSDKEVNKFIQRENPENIEEVETFIDKITTGIKNGDNCYWGMTLKETTKIIGTICLWNFSDDKLKAEVGYGLNPAFHNRGFMSETLKCVLDFGFNKLNLLEISAYTHFENEASKKLLLKNNFNLVENAIDKENANNIIFCIENPPI